MCANEHDGLTLADDIREALRATFYPNGIGRAYENMGLTPGTWGTDAIDLELVPGSAFDGAPVAVIVDALIDVLLRFDCRVAPFALLNFLANDGRPCPPKKAHNTTLMSDRDASEAHIEALRSGWAPHLARFLARADELGTRHPQTLEHALGLPPLQLRILRRVMSQEFMISAAGDTEIAAYSRPDIDIAIEGLVKQGYVQVTAWSFGTPSAGDIPLLIRGRNGRRLAGAGIPPL